jgi:phytoene/squalene synthetase
VAVRFPSAASKKSHCRVDKNAVVDTGYDMFRLIDELALYIGHVVGTVGLLGLRIHTRHSDGSAAAKAASTPLP